MINATIEAVERFVCDMASQVPNLDGLTIIMPSHAFDQLTSSMAELRKHEPKPSYLGIVDANSAIVGAFAEVKLATSVGYVTVRREQMYRILER